MLEAHKCPAVHVQKEMMWLASYLLALAPQLNGEVSAGSCIAQGGLRGGSGRGLEFASSALWGELPLLLCYLRLSLFILFGFFFKLILLMVSEDS